MLDRGLFGLCLYSTLRLDRFVSCFASCFCVVIGQTLEFLRTRLVLHLYRLVRWGVYPLLALLHAFLPILYRNHYVSFVVSSFLYFSFLF